jgi:hypothetical protein
MFETSKPTPNPTNNSAKQKNPVAITSLDQLSDWIDSQLALLEKRHQDFETANSTRGYFQR